MKSFNFGTFLIGFGFGLVFAFFFIRLYFVNYWYNTEEITISDEMIIERAKELGFVEITDILKKNAE